MCVLHQTRAVFILAVSLLVVEDSNVCAYVHIKAFRIISLSVVVQWSRSMSVTASSFGEKDEEEITVLLTKAGLLHLRSNFVQEKVRPLTLEGTLAN